MPTKLSGNCLPGCSLFKVVAVLLQSGGTCGPSPEGSALDAPLGAVTRPRSAPRLSTRRAACFSTYLPSKTAKQGLQHRKVWQAL